MKKPLMFLLLLSVASLLVFQLTWPSRCAIELSSIPATDVAGDVASKNNAARAARSVVRLDMRAADDPDARWCAGFVIRPGLVVTAAHCVKIIPERTDVVFYDGRSSRAGFIGFSSKYDYAWLGVDTLDVPPLEVGPPVTDGDRVCAIGHPQRQDWTITCGTASINRNEPYEIRSDAAVAPGSSGGPLVDSSGRVVGIISQRGLWEMNFMSFAVAWSYVELPK